MTRDAALSILRSNENMLRSRGVTSLRVFGPVAREEASTLSDLDLLAEFDPALPVSLLDIVRIESILGDVVGTRVDLMEERSLKPRIRAQALREAVLAF